MSAKKAPSRSGSEAGRLPGRSWCLLVGLGGLFAWLLFGLVLETLHGFKHPAYLDVPVRRELWRLAHAHGTLFSLVAVVLHLLLAKLTIAAAAARKVDRWFAIGSVVLPLGFLLGGVRPYEADPGIVVALVPAGGVMAAAALLVLLFEVARLRTLR
jgi:hypothetical protein